ncbi:MIP family Ig-specific serine endopeptidase [Mesomycoplasma ovipneumoniae]|uniref:MIP family Ig-specific serine endopeptidase n=1 Tax=Mesomycoplasma ovipneumoniae TaxID=29562 RepID=UPI00308030F2
MKKNNKEIGKLKTFLIISGSIVTPLSSVAFLVACHEKEQPKVTKPNKPKKEIEQKPSTSSDSTKETITTPSENNPQNDQQDFVPHFNPNFIQRGIENAKRLREQQKQELATNLAKLTDVQAYEKLKNRTFAIAFNSVDKTDENNPDDVVKYEPTGTGWLLDASYNENKTEVMLYIATNAHVFARSFNTLDSKYKHTFPEYFTEPNNGEKVDSFIIGVPKKEANIQAIDNNTRPDANNNPVYFINKQLGEGSEIGIEGIFDNPKTVFVALNIFDNQTNEQLKQTSTTSPASQKINNGIGKDFAVFGLKVNLAKLDELISKNDANKENLQLFKEHIEKAIVDIEQDIAKFQTQQYPNHDKKAVPYISYDYTSIYQKGIAEPEKLGISESAILFPNTTKLYLLGYPNLDGQQFLMRNYPKNLTNKAFAISNDSFSNGLTLNDILSPNRSYSSFGFITFIENSGLYYGASGSLVINDYGLPVGIYSAVQTKGGNLDISGKAGYTPFVQIADFDSYGLAHNLIDGTNKKLFPKQEKSYRQNLKKLSENEGEFKDFRKTLLFPDGP